MTKNKPEASQQLSDETLMTTADLMAFLNLSRTKIWSMIQQDGLPAFKFGGDYRFRKSEILIWMEQYRIRNEESSSQ